MDLYITKCIVKIHLLPLFQQRRHGSASHTSSSSGSSTNGNFNTQRNETTVAISNQTRRNNGGTNVAPGKKSVLHHRKSSNTSLHNLNSSTSTNITSIENDHQHSTNIMAGREEDIASNVDTNHPYSVIAGGSRDGTIDRGNVKQMCIKRGTGERNFEGK